MLLELLDVLELPELLSKLWLRFLDFLFSYEEYMIVEVEDVRVDWEVIKSCTMIDYLSRQDGDIMPTLDYIILLCTKRNDGILL